MRPYSIRERIIRVTTRSTDGLHRSPPSSVWSTSASPLSRLWLGQLAFTPNIQRWTHHGNPPRTDTMPLTVKNSICLTGSQKRHLRLPAVPALLLPLPVTEDLPPLLPHSDYPPCPSRVCWTGYRRRDTHRSRCPRRPCGRCRLSLATI